MRRWNIDSPSFGNGSWNGHSGSIDHRDTETTETGEQRKGIPDALNDLCYRIVGAGIEVHRELGPGFLEAAYEEAFAIELARRGLAFERQVTIPVVYKDQIVSEYRLDLIVECLVVVELKAVASVQSIHMAQLLAYLKAAGHQVGLLINFHVPILKNGIHRVLWDL